MVAKKNIIVIFALLCAAMAIAARADTKAARAVGPSDRHYLRNLRDSREHETDILPIMMYDGSFISVIESAYLHVRDAQDITLSDMGLDEKSVLESMFFERNIVVPNFPYDRYPWARYIDTRTPIYAIDYNDHIIYIIARDEKSVTFGHNRA